MDILHFLSMQVFVNQSRISSVLYTVGRVTSWTTPEFQPNTEHTFEVAAINGAPINNGQGVYSTVVSAKTGFGGTLLKCYVIIHLTSTSAVYRIL